MTALVAALTADWGRERSWTLQSYTEAGGYQALAMALELGGAKVTEMVKEAGLRGRGGAGFPTGVKWGFLPPIDPADPAPKPRYLVVNADESEPGTCKDIPLMLASPHTLVEGVIVSSFAIGAHQAFIYVRGEVVHVIRRLQAAVA